MFIFDRIVFATAWHASLLQTPLLFAVVDEDGDDVVVEVELEVQVSLLKVLPADVKAKQNLSKKSLIF